MKTKATIIILIFAVAIAFVAAESESITLFITTKVIAAGVLWCGCKLYNRWEPELNKPVQ